jgi:hypothetical protein
MFWAVMRHWFVEHVWSAIVAVGVILGIIAAIITIFPSKPSIAWIQPRTNKVTTLPNDIGNHNGPIFGDVVAIDGKVSVSVIEIVANEIRFTGNGAIEARSVHIVANIMSGGVISVSGQPGASGSGPNLGGGAGVPGGNIRIVVGKIEGTRFLATGGAGGNGANGSRGPNGRSGNCGGFGAYVGAAPGQQGQRGGDAGTGGNGGSIAIITSSKTAGLVTIADGGRPGDAGDGGPGGQGGSGCTGLGGTQPTRANGPVGENGSSASPGQPGTVTSRRIDDFNELAAELRTKLSENPSTVSDIVDQALGQ